MIRTGLRVCLLLLVSGLILGQPLAAQPRLAGSVFDTASRPLAGARVELFPLLPNYEAGRLRLADGEPEPAAFGRSDATGRYAFAAPQTGIWRVVVRAAGRVPMQYGPLLLLESIELPPLVLPADAGFHLQVTEDDGRPVAGAWIFGEPAGAGRAEGWRPDFRVGRTAADGTLALPRLDGEALMAEILAPGRAWQERAQAPGGVRKLDRDPGMERRFRVVDAAGRGVPDVLVRAGDLAWPQAVSDSEGKVSIRVRAGEPAPILLVTRDGRQERSILPASPASEREDRFVVGDPRTVAGRVLDSSTGKPLPGAFIGVEDDPGRLVRSDSAGEYRLAAPGARRFSLTVNAQGFLSQRMWVTPAQIRKARVSTMTLDRASRLRGRILGPAGRPLPGVAVTAIPESALSVRTFAAQDPVADRTETDATGSFELRRLGSGVAYEIRAERPGSFPAAAMAVAPHLEETGAPVQLQLLPARALRGSVQDPSKRPLEGVAFRLRPSRRPGFAVPAAEEEAAPRGTSDPKGSFLLADVPAAEIDLEAVKPGFAPALRRGIRLPPGSGPLDLGTIVLAPGASLAGKVVDSQGKPVPQAEVFIVESLPPVGSEEGRLRQRKPQATTGPDGGFQLRDQPAGVPLNLVVLAVDHLPGQVRGVRPPVSQSSQASQPITVRLDPAWSVNGQVVSEEGEPIAGARLDLTWQAILPDDPEQRRIGPQIVRTAVSDRQGRFVLRGMPKGKARVDVAAHGFVRTENLEISMPSPDPQGEWVIVLKRGSILEGRVTTTAGAPVEGVRVGVAGTGGLSDGDGRYQVEGVPLGSQEVRIAHPSYRSRVERKQIESGVNLLDVELEAGVEVSGRVVGEDREPIAGAEVWLISRQQRDFPEYRARSGQDGSFRLSPVAGGSYTLGAEAESRARTELDAAVEVARENVTGLEVTLRQGATLSGRILGLSPEELAVVGVEASAEDKGSVPARIDAQGRYEIRHLQPGDWQVRAALWEGRRQVEVRVPVGPADREVSRDLEFRPRLTLSGQVLYEEEPLADTRVSIRGERFAAGRDTTTDFDGRFRLEDLEPDTYWVGLSKPSKRLVHNATVELVDDREVVIRIEASTLAGRVGETASGEPIGDAQLMLRHPAGPEGPEFLVTGASQADGSFLLLRVPAGSYQLTVRAEGFSPAEQEVQVAAGQDLQGLDLRLSRAQGLEVVVRKASGRVPELVHLLARSLDGKGSVSETHRPDPSGKIRITTLPPGSWSLSVSGTGGGVVTSTVQAPSEQPVSMTLPAAARLRVRVPALVTSNLNASLVILGSDQQPFWTLGPGGRLEQQWPLSGGTAVVEGLPAGAWTLQVKAPDGQAWTSVVSTSGLSDAVVNVD
jgi:hypothetical protein